MQECPPGIDQPPHPTRILGVSKNLEISSPQGQLPPKGKGRHLVILTTHHALKLQGLLRGHNDLE